MSESAQRLPSSPSYAEDLALVRRVEKGDPDAQHEFVDLYLGRLPSMLRAIFFRLGARADEQDIPDLLQDCLAVIWRRLPTYRGEAALFTWVFRVCQFEVLNGMRRLRRVRERSVPTEFKELDALPGSDSPESDASLFMDVQEGLSVIPSEEAIVLRLKHFDHLTLAQIATRMSIPMSQVRHLYYRAIKRLGDYFKSRDWFEDGEGAS